MMSEADLVRRAQEAARAGVPFSRLWLSTVCQDRGLVARYLNPQTHDRCLQAYNAISPPVARV